MPDDPPISHSPALQPSVPQLPVVDLIGLRFSLQHLRLVGYGLLAVWLSEILNLLSSPGLGEIGSRLHYTSQFLDLSPILLVAIGLIAFQGGLRRSAFERLLLPVLLSLLPLLSALHFFLAPVSVANAVTLVQKQQQIGRDQIQRIDQQIDRAATILRESDSIEALLSGLQRIPGLQVRVPADVSVSEARQQVNLSLRRERDRLRERIEANVSNSREAFLRRSIINAALALLVGLLLWGLHRGAMREMELAIPFLDWVLLHGEASQHPEALQSLLRFQRACVALGWFGMLERALRLMRRVVVRSSPQDQGQEADPSLLADAQQPPLNPFEDLPEPPPGYPGRAAVPALLPRGLFSSLLQGGASGHGPHPADAASGSADQGWLAAAPWQDMPTAASAASEASAAAGHSASGPATGQGDPQVGSGADQGPDAAASPVVDRSPWLVLPSDATAAADQGFDADPINDLMRRGHQAQLRREERRRRRDLDRYRALRQQMERAGADPFGLMGLEQSEPAEQPLADPSAQNGQPEAAAPDAQPAGPSFPAMADAQSLSPRQLRRLQRDHERARAALSRMAWSEAIHDLDNPDAELQRQLFEELSREELEWRHRSAMEANQERPGGLAALWSWFLRHL